MSPRLAKSGIGLKPHLPFTPDSTYFCWLWCGFCTSWSLILSPSYTIGLEILLRCILYHQRLPNAGTQFRTWSGLPVTALQGLSQGVHFCVRSPGACLFAITNTCTYSQPTRFPDGRGIISPSCPAAPGFALTGGSCQVATTPLGFLLRLSCSRNRVPRPGLFRIDWKSTQGSASTSGYLWAPFARL